YSFNSAEKKDVRAPVRVGIRSFRWYASASRRAMTSTKPSFAAIAEIIKQRHAIGFGPDANHSSFGKGFVVPLDGFLPVERHVEMIAAEVHSQRVPLVGGDLHIRSFLLRPLASDGVVNGHVIFKRVGA